MAEISLLTHGIKVEIGFVFEDKKVTFDITETEGPPPEELDRNLRYLADWVHFLLGEEYQILVKFKGEPWEPKKKFLVSKE